MPKQIYALLIGIDDYPPEADRLSGCVNDAKNLESYLKAHFGAYANIKMLLNENATRHNIIEGFKHFDQAKAGEICLFHFSGHGSQAPAPAAFWHLESDRKLECLVCYDSDTNGGDLFDKELSYLIHVATKHKDIHFVVITDCCHAGTNTRMRLGKVRRKRASNRTISAENFYGFEHYCEEEQGRFTPPHGRHIHLSASKSDELAKEIFAGTHYSGAFSYALLHTLQHRGAALSYFRLMELVNLKVRNLVDHQSPQLEAIEAEDKQLCFLTGESNGLLTEFLITFDKDLGWVVNAGVLQGIQQGDELQLIDNQIQCIITEVFPNRSKVSFTAAEELTERNIYPAVIAKRQIAKTNIGFAPESESTAMEIFKAVCTKMQSALFECVEDDRETQYLLHASQNQYKLTLVESEHPIFFPVLGFTNNTAADLYFKLERVMKWRRLLELSNPYTSLPEQSIEFTFFRLTETDGYKDSAPADVVRCNGVIELPYLFEQGKWHQPAFRLFIHNSSNRTLWLSALYMGEDFSISNNLMHKKELAAHEEAWLLEWSGDIAHRSIITKIDDRLHQKGISQSLEYLKIVVSTEEIDTNHLNQHGFYDEPLSLHRAQSRRDAFSKPDWRTYEIAIRTSFPLFLQSDTSQTRFEGYGITIETPQAFDGQIRLSNQEEIFLGLNEPLHIQEDQSLMPFEFSTGLNYTPGLSVVELFKGNAQALPPFLKITFTQSSYKNITPFYYNITYKRLIELKYEIIGKYLLINSIPAETPSFPNDSSHKIFFYSKID